MNQVDQFRESFRATIDGSKSLSSQHLSSEDICAYHAGDKSAREEARIQDHLAECRECAALLLDLSAFSEQARQSETGEDVYAAWNEFKRAAGMSMPPRVVDFESNRRRKMSPLTVGLAIAASLIFVVLAGGIWMRIRRGATPEISRQTEPGPPQAVPSLTPPTAASPASDSPLPDKTAVTPEVPGLAPSPSKELIARNIAPAELYPNEALRGDPEVKAIQLTKDATTFSVILHVVRANPLGSYSVVVKDSSGSIAWSARVAFQKSTNTFRLRIPAKAVPAGDYQISVTGSGKGVSTKIAEYTVRFHQ